MKQAELDLKRQTLLMEDDRKRDEMEAEILGQRARFAEIEEARAAAVARVEMLEATAERVGREAREAGAAKGRDEAWREARHVAKMEMEAELRRLCKAAWRRNGHRGGGSA